jgi:hypothetical protein
MKKSMRFFLGIGLLVLIACSSCSENSEVQMKEAQQAMEKAKSVFAEELAASDWQNAMEAWDQAQAAVKEGKPAKNHFITAKSRFDKTYAIAKSKGETLSRDVQNGLVGINDRLGKIKAVLDSSRTSSKLRNEVKPMVQDLEVEVASVDSLLSQGNSLKASQLAREVQANLSKAERILIGKMP